MARNSELFAMRLPTDLDEFVTRAADARGMSKAALIRGALIDARDRWPYDHDEDPTRKRSRSSRRR